MYYDMNSSHIGYETTVCEVNSSTMVACVQQQQQQQQQQHHLVSSRQLLTPKKSTMSSSRYSNISDSDSTSPIRSLEDFNKTANDTANLFGPAPLMSASTAPANNSDLDKKNDVTNALSRFVKFHGPNKYNEKANEEDSTTTSGEQYRRCVESSSVTENSAPIQHKTSTMPLASRVNKRRRTIAAPTVTFNEDTDEPLGKRSRLDDDSTSHILNEIYTRMDHVESVVNSFNLRIANIENMMLQTKVDVQNYMLAQANNTINSLSGINFNNNNNNNSATSASSNAATTTPIIISPLATTPDPASIHGTISISTTSGITVTGGCRAAVEAAKCDMSPGPEKLMLYRNNAEPIKYRLFRKTPQLQEELSSYTKVCSIPTNQENPEKTKKYIKDAILKWNRQLCNHLLEKHYEELAEQPDENKKITVNKGQLTRQYFSIHGACTMVGTSMKLVTATEDELKKVIIESGERSKGVPRLDVNVSKPALINRRKSTTSTSSVSKLVYLEDSDEEKQQKQEDEKVDEEQSKVDVEKETNNE